jgi:hypothetical protein
MSARVHFGGALRAARLATIAMIVALVGCAGGAGDDGQRDPATTADRSMPKAVRRPAPAPAMTRQAVMRRLRGRRVVVSDRRVPLDPATLTCVGVGRPRRHGGAPAWSRFHCVQPTFPPGQTVGPDVVFLAETTATRGGLRLVGARLTSY